MRRSSAGRKGGVELARQALAVNSFITRTKDAELDRLTLARLLGLPSCRTLEDSKTVDNVTNLVLDEYSIEHGLSYYLAVAEKVEDDDGQEVPPEETILKKSVVSSPVDKPIRLSWMEAAAVEAAVVQTGGINNGLMNLIKDAWWPQTIDKKTFESISDTDRSVNSETIIQCSAAILNHKTIKFNYRDEKGHETSRHVAPSRLKHENAWMLAAVDLVKRERRNFRLDRMSNITNAGDADPNIFDEIPEERTQTVRLLFKNTTWLDVFLWPNMSMDDTPQDGYVASGQIPYFSGSKFLPAQIAASAGEVICDSDDVMKAAEAWRDALRAELP